MEDTPEARRQLAGRLFEVGGRPISPDDPIFDVVFIAREVARDENARLSQDLEALASSIAQRLAAESAKLQAVAKETQSLVERLEKTAERLEAAETIRKQNGPAQVGLLVGEISKVFTAKVNEAVQAAVRK